MKMKGYFLIAMMAATLAIGCSKDASDPVMPERNPERFVDGVIEIYGPTTDSGDFNPQFHDIALAQVRNWFTEDAWDDAQGHGCIAVTLNRQNNDPQSIQTCIPVA